MERLVVLVLVAVVSGARPSSAWAQAQTTEPSAPTSGARPAPVQVLGYPALDVDQDAIVQVLRSGAFAELERMFAALEAAARDDITQELLLDASYRAFYGSDASIRGRLDEWVTSNPRSDAALIARAQFHTARAWEARGEDFRIANAAAAREAVVAGFEDVGRAYQLDPENLSVYAAGIRLHGVSGWSDEAAMLVDAGLERFPTSYWLRYVALRLMRPRFGGSYELMRAFSQDAQQHVSANPRLISLLGSAAIEEGVTLGQAQRYEEAVAKIEEARPYGPDWDFYFERGHHMYHADHYLASIPVLDTAVAMHPIYESVLAYRGRAQYWGARLETKVSEDRIALLNGAVADFVDAAKRSQADQAISDNLANAMAARGRCTQFPANCFASEATPTPGETLATGPWWARVLYFVMALPYTLWVIFVDGQRMHLLPAPILGLATCAWSFREWRKQRFWAPRLIHTMAALALATIIAINAAWVSAGGAMNAQRYVVIAIFGMFPYVAYLLFLGPKYLGRKRAPSRARPLPWVDGKPPAPSTGGSGSSTRGSSAGR